MEQDDGFRLATEGTAIQRLLTSALPPGWAVIGRCRQGGLGPAPQPTGCHVLAHPEIGIALLDVAPHTTPNAEARLRRLLESAEPGARLFGTPPIWHGRVEPEALHRLPALLEQAFAALPPAQHGDGSAWIAAVRDALDADPAWEAAGRAKRPIPPLPDASFPDEEEGEEDGPPPRPGGRGMATGSRRLLLGLAFACVFLLGLGAGVLLVPGQEESGPGGPVAVAGPPPPAEPARQVAGATEAPPAVRAAPGASGSAPAAPARPGPDPNAEAADPVPSRAPPEPVAAAPPDAPPPRAAPPVPPAEPPAAGGPAALDGPPATIRFAAPEAGPMAAADRPPPAPPQATTAPADGPASDAIRPDGAAASLVAPPLPSPPPRPGLPAAPVAADASGADPGATAPAPATGSAVGGGAARRPAPAVAEAEEGAPQATAGADLPLPPAAIAQRPPPRPAQRASVSYDRRCGDALFRWQQGARLTAAEMAFVRDGCAAPARR